MRNVTDVQRYLAGVLGEGVSLNFDYGALIERLIAAKLLKYDRKRGEYHFPFEDKFYAIVDDTEAEAQERAKEMIG